MGSPAVTSFGSGAFQYGKSRQFWFQLDAELIVYGATEPTAKVTLQGEPVKLRPDGTFTMRFSLPDSRQIIPAVWLVDNGRIALTAPIAAGLGRVDDLPALLTEASAKEKSDALAMAVINRQLETARLCLEAGAEVN